MKSRKENPLFLEKGVNSNRYQGSFSLIRVQTEKEQNLKSASKTNLLDSMSAVRIVYVLFSAFDDGEAWA